jgi:hypothetical protein
MRAAKPYETLAELWAGREERPEMLEARRFWREHLADNQRPRQQLTSSRSSM